MPTTIRSASNQEAIESRPLRFCMISIFYPPYSFGGDAIYCLRLAQELVRNGYEVDIIHCADSYHAVTKQVDEFAYPASDGITVHRIESGGGGLSAVRGAPNRPPVASTERPCSDIGRKAIRRHTLSQHLVIWACCFRNTRRWIAAANHDDPRSLAGLPDERHVEERQPSLRHPHLPDVFRALASTASVVALRRTDASNA